MHCIGVFEQHELHTPDADLPDRAHLLTTVMPSTTMQQSILADTTFTNNRLGNLIVSLLEQSIDLVAAMARMKQPTTHL